MIKLQNPYQDRPGHDCFGCSPRNPAGLRMVFYEDGDEVVSTWQADERYQGFHDVLHGGIQATMMDEIASWVVFVKAGTAGVTRALNVKYKKPVFLTRGDVVLRARLASLRHGLAVIRVDLCDGEGTLCSTGEATYVALPEDRARKDLHYPGKSAFYPMEK
ncbi:MAG: PaaI family thioesterase [Bacteroidales bacterium]